MLHTYFKNIDWDRKLSQSFIHHPVWTIFFLIIVPPMGTLLAAALFMTAFVLPMSMILGWA